MDCLLGELVGSSVYAGESVGPCGGRILGESVGCCVGRSLGKNPSMDRGVNLLAGPVVFVDCLENPSMNCLEYSLAFVMAGSL